MTEQRDVGLVQSDMSFLCSLHQRRDKGTQTFLNLSQMYLYSTFHSYQGESARRRGQHLTPLAGTQVSHGTKVNLVGMLMEQISMYPLEMELTNIDTKACFLPEASSRQSKERRQQQSLPVLLPRGNGKRCVYHKSNGH